MLEITYGLVCAAMLVVMLFLCGYSVHALWIGSRSRRPLSKGHWPKVALIIPCKGIDIDLEENLRRHFHHDYPNYVIVFTVADADDPSCAVIRKLVQTEPGVAASLVVAPRLPDCVEKASNQLAALQSLPGDVEVIVCADSDGLARDGDWLRALVADLRRCTLTSGFRWYMPVRPSLVGFLQSAWDSTWFLLHALGKTAWGGAMAFSRESYERLKFADSLRCAITDDLALRVATYQGGERTGFTPGAMMISEPVDRFEDFYNWAVRQSLFVRLVTPWIWLMGFCTANVYGAFFVLSVALLIVPGQFVGWPLPATALSVVALYYAARGWLDYRIARLYFPDHQDRTACLRWAYYWANPLADLLAPVVAYNSLLKRTFRWRGLAYRFCQGRVVCQDR